MLSAVDAVIRWRFPPVPVGEGDAGYAVRSPGTYYTPS